MIPKAIIITILFITSGIFYYNLTDATPDLQTFQIARVIDGDTAELTNGARLRFIGINTPEKNMPYYQEAKDFLENTLAPFDAEGYPTGESVQIETHGTDKYGRILSYVFLNDENINKQIIAQGLATLYYYDKDAHYEELKQAEEFARLNQEALWKKSPDENCIKLIEFKTDEPEKLILQNTCDKILNITFKDDATHIYHATLEPKSTYTKSFSHIWNTDGDSIYIRDNKGLLLFYRY